MQTVSGVLHAVTSAAAGLQARMDLTLNWLQLDLIVQGHLYTDQTDIIPTLLVTFYFYRNILLPFLNCPSSTHLHKDNMVVKHLIVFLPTSVTFCVGTKIPHRDGVHTLSAALAVMFPIHLSLTVKL